MVFSDSRIIAITSATSSVASRILSTVPKRALRRAPVSTRQPIVSTSEVQILSHHLTLFTLFPRFDEFAALELLLQRAERHYFFAVTVAVGELHTGSSGFRRSELIRNGHDVLRGSRNGGNFCVCFFHLLNHRAI